MKLPERSEFVISVISEIVSVDNIKAEKRTSSRTMTRLPTSENQ